MIRKFKNTKIVLLAILCMLLLTSTLQAVSPAKLLVFWWCEGFFHGSIPVGNKALELMGERTRAYDVVVTDDYSVFTAKKLKQFDAVCLNNATGLKFDPKGTPERLRSMSQTIRL